MEVHPGVFVSRTSTDDWQSDPEVGGGAEEHVLFDTGSLRAGLTRFTTRVPENLEWVLPQTEVLLVLEGEVQIEIEGGPTLEMKPGDMASLPKGAVTRWSFKLPFKEMWVLADE
ncbi:MAG TPA: cupin domain-containing protein [Actinomycetes bacterium]|nr:cupin domain-containing protein [Actinomycetes bacterium]